MAGDEVNSPLHRAPGMCQPYTVTILSLLVGQELC